MHNDITRERNGEIIAQALLADSLDESLVIHAGATDIASYPLLQGRKRLSGIDDSKKQLITLVSIFPKERLEGFHGRSLDLSIAIGLVDFPDGVENIIALGHFFLAEIPGPLRY